MKKLKLITSLIALSTPFAFADSFIDSSNSNVYVDANVGLNTSWNTLGLSADVGYMFNRYLGVEGGLTYSPGYSYNNGSTSYNSSYWMVDAAAKGVLPLTQLFSLYGKLGLGINEYSGWSGNGPSPSYSGSNVGVLLGIGAQFNISRQWSLHLEDTTVTGPNPNMLMFGGEYKF